MPRNDLTRRSLLALLASTGAASAVDPRSAVASLLSSDTPEPRLYSVDLGAVSAGVRTVSPGGRFDLAGLRWSGPERPSIEIRTQFADGSWGPWAPGAGTGHGPDGAEAGRVTGTDQVGQPVWVGRSRKLQLRLAEAVHGLRLHLVDAGPRGGPGPTASAAALPLASPVLDAGPGQPPIIARRAWAGRDSPPRVAPEYGDVKLGFVHHTVNPNGYSPEEVPAMLRSIYVFHRDVNGWDDIGYNFAIDAFGRIFEARAGGIDEPVVGAQAGGYNLVSTGVAMLGDFMTTPISSAARQALQRLLAWKLSLHGVPIEGHVVVRVDPSGASFSRFPANARVTLPRVAGHRDADTTDCPGNVLYRELPAIREASARLAGKPARLRIEMSEAEVPAATPEALEGAGTPGGTTGPTGPTGPTGATGPTGPTAAPEGTRGEQLAGKLSHLDGSPLGGATIELQARHVSHLGEVVEEQTLATARTDSGGNWSLPVAVVHPEAVHPRYEGKGRKRHRLSEPTVPLRALYRGGGGRPAAVSAPLNAKGRLTLDT